MKLGFGIAVRFLFSNKGQTGMIILGIAIGVSVQIFIGSLIQGLQKSLVEKTIGTSSHITITADTDDKLISNYQSVLDKIRGDERLDALTAVCDNQAFLRMDEVSQFLLVRGFHIDEADKIYDFISRIKQGTYPKNDREIIVGESLMQEFDLSLGDEITLMSTSQKSGVFKIVGAFDLQVAALNDTWAITSISDVQEVFEIGNKVTSVEMQIKEDQVFDADLIAAEIGDVINDPELETDNWKVANEQLLSGLQGQSISSLMIQIFVIISVVLGIASVLAITVMQKSRQIGILKAMGIKNKDAGFVFLFEGLMFGIMGAIVGVGLGLGLAFSFTKFALNSDGTPVVALFIDPAFILLSGLIAVVASVIAASIPAIRSSKLDPIDIIRNN